MLGAVEPINSSAAWPKSLEKPGRAAALPRSPVRGTVLLPFAPRPGLQWAIIDAVASANGAAAGAKSRRRWNRRGTRCRGSFARCTGIRSRGRVWTALLSSSRRLWKSTSENGPALSLLKRALQRRCWRRPVLYARGEPQQAPAS